MYLWELILSLGTFCTFRNFLYIYELIVSLGTYCFFSNFVVCLETDFFKNLFHSKKLFDFLETLVSFETFCIFRNIYAYFLKIVESLRDNLIYSSFQRLFKFLNILI